MRCDAHRQLGQTVNMVTSDGARGYYSHRLRRSVQFASVLNAVAILRLCSLIVQVNSETDTNGLKFFALYVLSVTVVALGSVAWFQLRASKKSKRYLAGCSLCLASIYALIVNQVENYYFSVPYVVVHIVVALWAVAEIANEWRGTR